MSWVIVSLVFFGQFNRVTIASCMLGLDKREMVMEMSCTFKAHFVKVLLAGLIISLGLSLSPVTLAKKKPRPSPPPTLADVAIYTDNGTWDISIASIKAFIRWRAQDQELSIAELSAWDINNLSLSGYQMLILPGGYAYDYKVALNASGNQNIRNFVDNGGAYVGISAGTFYASDVIVWQGETFDYPLNLFDGITDGEITEIAPWPDFAMTIIDIEPDVEGVTEKHPSSEDVLFFGEGMMQKNSGSNQNVRVFARWRVPGTRYDGEPAIIGFDYGDGRALLIGPHLEVEENDPRDGNDFGSSLSDYGSDWPLLSRMMDWVEQRTEFTALPFGEPAPDIWGPVIALSGVPSQVTEGSLIHFDADIIDAEMGVKDATLTVAGLQQQFSVPLSNQDNLHDEGFESGSVAPPWKVDSHWAVVPNVPWEGSFHLQARGTGANNPSYALIQLDNLAGYATVNVEYARMLVGLDRNDDFAVEWSDNGGISWIELEHLGKRTGREDNYQVKRFELGALTGSLSLRFMCEASGNAEMCRVDTVRITGLFENWQAEVNTSGLSGEYRYTLDAKDMRENDAVPAVGSFIVVPAIE